MLCERCLGLMDQEVVFGESRRTTLWKCINCGERIDAVIAKNRVDPEPPQKGGRSRNDVFDGPLRVWEDQNECEQGEVSGREVGSSQGEVQRESPQGDVLRLSVEDGVEGEDKGESRS